MGRVPPTAFRQVMACTTVHTYAITITKRMCLANGDSVVQMLVNGKLIYLTCCLKE